METKEENFTISNYPLEQTEFLYGQKQGKVSSTQNNFSSILWTISYGTIKSELDLKGRDRFDNEKNKVFDYSMFSYRIDTPCGFAVNEMIKFHGMSQTV